MAIKYVNSILVILFVCLGYFSKAQEIQKTSNWTKHTLFTDVSSDGKWVVVNDMQDKNNVILIQTESGVRKELGSIILLKFLKNNDILSFVDDKSNLHLIDLKTLKTILQVEVLHKRYFTNHDQTIISYLRKGEKEKKDLQLLDLKSNKSYTIHDVENYQWHPVKDDLIFLTSNTDSNTKTLKKWKSGSENQQSLFISQKNEVKILGWQSDQKSILLLENTVDGGILYTINTQNKEVKSLACKTLFSDEEVRKINGFDTTSDRNGIVFFNVDIVKSKNDNYIIWDTQDALIAPRKAVAEKYVLNKQSIRWDTKTNEFSIITSNKLNAVIIKPNFNYALAYDFLENEPSTEQYTVADLYLKNYEKGEEKLIVPAHYFSYDYLSFSPSGKYIMYFKDKKWWGYDTENDKYFDITIPSNYSLYKTNDMYYKHPTPYGVEGWSINENEVFVYDEFDIWMYDIKNGTAKRLTASNGDISYRFNKKERKNTSHIDINQKLMLDLSTKDEQNGFAFFEKGKIVPIVLESYTIENTVCINKRTCFFKKFRYNLSPVIERIDLATKKRKMVYQSNPDLAKLDLGKSESIEYKNIKGNKSKGILLYPTNFNPTKQYPVIYYIYENMTYKVNQFASPTKHTEDGFNILNYILDGYFVFLPNLDYQIGNLGESIVVNIENSVEELASRSYIDKNRLGLIGHSFGGYEAAFIATHSNLFKAIVAGSGVMDLVSWSHDVQWEGWFREQAWRLESQQFRMKDSYYTDKNNYIRNSPFYQVENMKTPLLLWAGKSDYNINWYQSIYMYMAMKKLNKEGKLILFNNDGHYLTRKENQEMLYNSILSWFNTYLK